MTAWSEVQMAEEVISLIPNKSVVNLGIGLPSKVSDIKIKKSIVIQSENGVLGVQGRPKPGDANPNLINAAKETISTCEGASFFDSSLSFEMIRGGHIDVAVLGGMEVDTQGSLANWMIPGKKVTGMGGAMDLVNGPKTVIVMMSHFNKKNEEKLKRICTLPLTGHSCVDYVITNWGIFKPIDNKFKVIKLSSQKFWSKNIDSDLYALYDEEE